MAHTVEGNDTVGYRVIDSEAGPLTGRKPTHDDALSAAGLKPQPRVKKPVEDKP
jgi:hypothetical protein